MAVSTVNAFASGTASSTASMLPASVSWQSLAPVTASPSDSIVLPLFGSNQQPLGVGQLSALKLYSAQAALFSQARAHAAQFSVKMCGAGRDASLPRSRLDQQRSSRKACKNNSDHGDHSSINHSKPKVKRNNGKAMQSL